MVFDILNLAVKRPAPYGTNFLTYVRHLPAVPQPVDKQLCVRPVAQHKGELADNIGPSAAIDSNVGHVAQVDLRFLQTVSNGARREACAVLNAAEALLFGRSQ